MIIRIVSNVSYSGFNPIPNINDLDIGIDDDDVVVFC